MGFLRMGLDRTATMTAVAPCRKVRRIPRIETTGICESIPPESDRKRRDETVDKGQGVPAVEFDGDSGEKGEGDDADDDDGSG